MYRWFITIIAHNYAYEPVTKDDPPSRFLFFMATENLPSIGLWALINQHYVFEKPHVHYLFAIHWGIFFHAQLQQFFCRDDLKEQSRRFFFIPSANLT